MIGELKNKLKEKFDEISMVRPGLNESGAYKIESNIKQIIDLLFDLGHNADCSETNKESAFYSLARLQHIQGKELFFVLSSYKKATQNNAPRIREREYVKDLQKTKDIVLHFRPDFL